MGLNTIAAYTFWNHHEESEGRFDFTTGNRDIAKFIRIAQEEGMWVLLRPGPYVCAEWDFGGIPPYLLRDPELKIRSMYPRYMSAAGALHRPARRHRASLLVTRGGPVLMVQVENEYGSYGNDRNYMKRLKDVWVKSGIDVPFFTGDGPTAHMLEAGHLEGAAIGLDSGSDEKDWALARTIAPGVPIFSSETYPGWLTHWGEAWASPSIDALKKEVTFLLGAKKSFNFYVVHGGTNFGFTAGANSGARGTNTTSPATTTTRQSTSRDGRRPSTMLREMLAEALPAGESLPPVPDPIPAIAMIPEFEMRPFTSLWGNLPSPVRSVHPRPFEMYGQNQGTCAVPHHAGRTQEREAGDHRSPRLCDGVRRRRAGGHH